MKIDVMLNDGRELVVEYDRNPSDPDVGVMSDDYQIHSVHEGPRDVTDEVDFDEVKNLIREVNEAWIESCREDMDNWRHEHGYGGESAVDY